MEAGQTQSAFNRIAGTLGAKKVTLLSAKVEAKKGRGRAEVPLPDTVAAQVGINAAFGAESRMSQQTYLEFDKPDRPPFVPPDLKPWVNGDSTIEAMAGTRLETNVTRHKAVLELKENDQYNARIVAQYDQIGFDVGGEYESLTHSFWHFDIEFWPKSEVA